MRGLEGKKIVLGVTGGIAAFKAADLASKLTQAGAEVHGVMTPSAQEFITPLTFRSLTGQEVVTRIFDLKSQYSIEHVALAELADIVVVAPATANNIARIASGPGARGGALTKKPWERGGSPRAGAARDRGASVVLVSAPTALPKPVGVE